MAIVFLAGAALAEPLWAQATAEKDVVKDVIVNDATNYVGDRIRFAVKVDAKLRKAPQTVLCIPPLTRMSVIGKDDSSKNLIVKIADGTKACDGSAIDTGEAYLITLDTLAQSGLARTGATYGALVVPFKYHLTGNKDFTGSSTLGAYLGYRFETANAIGYTLTPVAFMGGSTVSVPTSSGGEIKDQNFAGFAYGVGLIGTFKGSFQAGVVLGWDRVSKSAGYQYNGKPWVAVEIGFSFMQ
jgi:hypothetical protein